MEQQTIKIELYQVWKSITTNRKVVVKARNIEAIRKDLADYVFVCDKPHRDEDYSYLCGSDYCRCSQ